MDLKLENSHVFVTGASGGIGLETARVFLKEGCNVSLHYNTNEAPLQDLLSEYFDHTIAVKANVLNENEIINAIRKSIERFGSIHSIIINHGIWIEDTVPLAEMTLTQWNKTLGINLTGSFLFAREYLKQLENLTGNVENVSIVFIGSTAGKFGEENHADYSATKAAMMYGLTRSLKNEIIRIHPFGRVNTVMPGWVLTPMAENALDDEMVLNKALQTMALHKVAKPIDVANAVLFLVSDEISGHVSGQIFEVSGGMEGRVLHPLK